MCKFYQYCCLEHVLKTQNYINILNRTNFLTTIKWALSTITLDETHITVLMSIFSACVTSVNLFLEPLNLKSQNFRTFTLIPNTDSKILEGTPTNYKNHKLLLCSMMPYAMGGQVNELWKAHFRRQLRQEPCLSSSSQTYSSNTARQKAALTFC